MRAAQWREVRGKVVIERPRPRRPWYRVPWEWLGFLMSTRRIRLDERSGFLWRRFDGRHSVAELVEEMRAEFGAEVEPAEERVGLLVRQLRGQDLVAYPGWEADGATLPVLRSNGR